MFQLVAAGKLLSTLDFVYKMTVSAFAASKCNTSIIKNIFESPQLIRPTPDLNLIMASATPSYTTAHVKWCNHGDVSL